MSGISGVVSSVRMRTGLAIAVATVWLALPCAAASASPGLGVGSSSVFVDSSGDETGFGPVLQSTGAGVNVANGNLVVHEVDDVIVNSDSSVVDPLFGIDRWYNSLSTVRRDIGTGWTTGLGLDVRLDRPDADHLVLTAPSEVQAHFTRASDGSYSSDSPDFAIAVNGTGYDVSDIPATRTLSFDAGLKLTTVTDAAGPSERYDYTSAAGQDRLSAVYGPTGTATRFSYDGTGSIIEADNPGSQHGYYHYSGALLHDVTTPQGVRTDYSYDGSSRLTGISRTGYVASISYDAAGRVASFSETDGDGVTTTAQFAYHAPSGGTCDPTTDASQTDVTGPDGPSSYCFDANGQLTSDTLLNESDLFDRDDVDDMDHSVADDGYGDEDTTGHCPSGADPSGDCNADALSYDTNRDILSQGADTVDSDADDDGSGGAGLRSAHTRSASSTPIASDMLKGGAGWGVADDKESIFTAPLNSYRAGLAVGYLRRSVPWDLVARGSHKVTYDFYTGGSTTLARDKTRLTRVDDYLRGARVRGIQVMLTIDKTADTSGNKIRPTEDQYLAGIKAIHSRYPWIKEYGSWNEMNYTGHEPFGTAAYAAGRRWYLLNKFCTKQGGHCSAIAGDFLDVTTADAAHPGIEDLAGYMKDFKNGAGYGRTTPPVAWGLHAYATATARNNSRIHAFAKVTACTGCQYTPKIFLTEQGGRFHKFPTTAEGDAHFAINHEREGSTRVTRFYYYNLKGDDKFDSGLLRPDGAARGLYGYYKSFTNP